MAAHLTSALNIGKELALFIVYLVVGSGLLLICCIQPAFGQDPKPDDCILEPDGGGDLTYDIISDDGAKLTCDYCKIGQLLVSNCTTDKPTECGLLRPGEQRMPHPNSCTSGYPCKTCPGPSLTVKTPCDPRGMDDTKCKCAKDYYSVNHEADICRPLPRCSKGFEPRPGVAEMVCQKCGDGFYQPNDNSTDLCRVHTDCIMTPGTDVSDNICKVDPLSSASPPTSPSEGVLSVPPTTTPTQASTGPTSSTPTSVTDPSNKTDVTASDDTNPRVLQSSFDGWLIVIMFGTHIFTCFCGMLLMWCIVSHRKKKDDNKAPTQDTMQMQQRGNSRESTHLNMPSSDEDTAEPSTRTIDVTTKKGKKEIRNKIKQRGKGRRY